MSSTRLGSADLLTIIDSFRSEVAVGRTLTVGEIMGRFAEAGYSFICILLCLPFLQPISLGPISTINGLVLVALGWQLMVGRPAPWLPRRVREAVLSPKFLDLLLGFCARIFKLCRRFSRQRLSWLVTGRPGHLLSGNLMIWSGLLLSIPLPGIPFNNTMPGIVIILVSVAELERDGLFVVLACIWFVLTLGYFGFLGYGLFFLGDHAFDWLCGIF